MTRIATLSNLDGSHIATFSSNDDGPWPRLDLMDITGWFGGVGVKDSPSPRLGHGMFENVTRFTGRALTIYVYSQYDTLEQRHLLERSFSSMLASAETYLLRVDIDGHALTARVQQDGEIDVKREGINGLSFQIPLHAPVPFLYADPQQYQIFPAGFGEGLVYPLFADNVINFGDVEPGARVPMHNGGTATAWPTFVVHGNWPSGFRISSGNRAIQFGAPVFSASPVTIDTRTGSATIRGEDWTHALTRRQWFSAGPGETIQPRLSAVDEGTGWADAFLSDTYL